MKDEISSNLNDGDLGSLNSFRFSIWVSFSNPSDFMFFPDFGYLKNMVGDLEDGLPFNITPLGFSLNPKISCSF
ncbi:hypothetical protein CDL12_27564 [Handroanthus impetiginosus]|uniref:Uncharacterized protein n=1 Tax=Handroanthus impetiginosus TaxID=429701 RepID=A0A2G9G3P4_9LAMI|nr:hypothetical protein CDL12_27564 [Handroanthus impetiginosus]